MKMLLKKPTHKNLNELDSLLEDLSNARYSSSIVTNESIPAKTKESEAVMREIQSDPKVLEELTDSRWKYQGYGIWESSENRSATNGMTVGSKGPSNFQNQVHSATVSASSATQELDDLMSSLNSFKMKGDDSSKDEVDDTNDVVAQKKADNTLDHMLGDLQHDMDKQGVKISTKGLCSACEKPIVGQVVTALGRTWHPEVKYKRYVFHQ